MAPPTAIDLQSVSDTQTATFLGPLSVNGVPARRAKAPQISGGIAAHASSDMFKSPVSHASDSIFRWPFLMLARVMASRKQNAGIVRPYL